jgi:hypothetical protein
MKNLILFGVVALLLSCSKEESSNVSTEPQGKYRLVEVLADPGDGSGTFQAVNSSKVIEFNSLGIVTSNGDLCSMSINSNSSSSGTYSTTNSIITINNCSDIAFEVNGNEITLFYACIEACRAKFVKQ